MSGVKVFLARIARRVWFRAALFTVAAIIFVLIIGWISPVLAFSPSLDLGQGSVETILEILASSMLAVTTFSLTAMVTAYSSAAQTATPRATQLLVEDVTSQNVLSTFIGTFAYSLVGIIALSTAYIDSEGRALLFLGTLLVIVIIIVTLLRWIGHLSDFGRMADIIDRVENAALDALKAYAQRPALGANVQVGDPTEGVAVPAERTGFVTYIDLGALERAAKGADVRIHVLASPGRAAAAGTPLASLSGPVDDAAASAIRGTFHIESHRNYDQDPRLGVIALSEIGSRALSPAVNDPGTAIEVLGSLQRVFMGMFAEQQADEVIHPHVWLTPVAVFDLIEDGFRPIARDGAAMLEVDMRMQKVLASLATASAADSGLFRAAAERASRRAEASLSKEDARILRRLRRSLWT